ncbi:single-stranded DNA-binding protein [Pseudoclavibacter helvolus]|uniref:single-stranded DNA-binding protein n=1 Tax=Pseudoclavibacter helvolus TaxID=255205 RepID=UPI003C79175B
MSRARIEIEGYTARDAELKHTQNGQAFLNVSVGHTPSRYDEQARKWEDTGETLWVQATLWGSIAELYAAVLPKGTFVRVSGYAEFKTWESNGKSGSNIVVKQATVGLMPEKQDKGGGGQRQQSDPGAFQGGQASGWATPGQGGATDDFQTPPF